MFDAHVSWSNRISCLQVEALHSTENVFSGGSLFWPITEASARKRANVCIQTGCSVVCSEEVHVQHWLLWTMAARYYEIRDVDV